MALILPALLLASLFTLALFDSSSTLGRWERLFGLLGIWSLVVVSALSAFSLL